MQQFVFQDYLKSQDIQKDILIKYSIGMGLIDESI